MAEEIKNYIVVLDGSGKQRILLNGDSGAIEVKDSNGEVVFRFDSTGGSLVLGGHGEFKNHILVSDGNDNERIALSGDDGVIAVKNSEGKELFFFSNKGDLWIKNSSENKIFHFENEPASLNVGGKGNNGSLAVKDKKNKTRMLISGLNGDMWAGNSAGKTRLFYDNTNANFIIGGEGKGGDLIVKDKNDKARIILNGNDGDVKLRGADCAENFDIAITDKIVPGTVMVIDHDERLRPSENAYDTKVAGVVSGAKNLRPGIILGSEPGKGYSVPIALSGKVYCRVDAQKHSIRVGDLLTTSTTVGHAMKAADPLKAFGAVIGKALCPLQKGNGLIPILVALQ
jgi:hypothetical protein